MILDAPPPEETLAFGVLGSLVQLFVQLLDRDSRWIFYNDDLPFIARDAPMHNPSEKAYILIFQAAAAAKPAASPSLALLLSGGARMQSPASPLPNLSTSGSGSST